MKEKIRDSIRSAIEALQRSEELPSFDIPEIRVERPKDDQFGEYTSNIALILAKQIGKNPREVAEMMRKELSLLCHSERVSESRNLKIPRQARDDKNEVFFEKIEVAGPGHLNFFLSQAALGNVLDDVIVKGNAFGNLEIGKGTKVNNEFISANPTGPLHLGNGRGGFFGDALSNVLRKAGYDVTNEYYVNDAGEQTIKLAHSVHGDDQAVYSGDYIQELKKKFGYGMSIEATAVQASAAVMSDYIKPTLEEMHIHFDSFISEKKDIVESGAVDRAIESLKEKNFTFEKEGALWFRSTDFGDDKDRVLVKSDSTKTYFASDCGYILSKLERGFSVFLETWGADHHGYIVRFRAAAEALGFKGEIRFNIVQLVRLVKDGKEVRMSKRAGNVVTIDELIDTVGHDVTRFFFLMYAPDTHMNFDLGLAEEHSQKNPVYYVQYAHARLASILRKAEEESMNAEGDATLLVHEKERALLQELLYFPEMIEETSQDFSVHRLPQFAIRLADKLHSFYDACRVIDAENKELSLARLKLVSGVRSVLSETLRLIGVSAPERM